MHQNPGHMPGEGDFPEDTFREPHVWLDPAARTLLNAGQFLRKHWTNCTLGLNTQICSESVRKSCSMAGPSPFTRPKVQCAS